MESIYGGICSVAFEDRIWGLFLIDIVCVIIITVLYRTNMEFSVFPVV